MAVRMYFCVKWPLAALCLCEQPVMGDSFFFILPCLVNRELASEDSGLPPRQGLEKCFSSSYNGETWMSKQQLIIPASRGRALPAPEAMKSKQGNQ